MVASYAIASETASEVDRILKDINWKPHKIVVTEEGTVFFAWDKKDRYACIECTCDGDVLYEITDFKETNIVNNLYLNIKSFLKFKAQYDNLK